MPSSRDQDKGRPEVVSRRLETSTRRPEDNNNTGDVVRSPSRRRRRCDECDLPARTAGRRRRTVLPRMGLSTLATPRRCFPLASHVEWACPHSLHRADASLW